MLAPLFHCTSLTKCQEKRKRLRWWEQSVSPSSTHFCVQGPVWHLTIFKPWILPHPNPTQVQKEDEELCFKRNTETIMPRSHILQKSHPWKPLLGWLSSSPWRQTLAAFSRYRWKIWGYSLYLSLKKKGHESTLPKLQLFWLLSYPQHKALRKLNLV